MIRRDMILIIDNYDSFTYNIVQYVGSINSNIRVIKNDECSIDEIICLPLSHIIISPGPGNPDDTGATKEIVNNFFGKIPILGICLGHQLLASIYGANIICSKNIVHGKMSNLVVSEKSEIFKSLPRSFDVVRYHSLIVENDSFADIFITAKTNENEIMALEDQDNKVYGLQFHPESISTQYGINMIENFLKLA